MPYTGDMHPGAGGSHSTGSGARADAGPAGAWANGGAEWSGQARRYGGAPLPFKAPPPAGPPPPKDAGHGAELPPAKRAKGGGGIIADGGEQGSRMMTFTGLGGVVYNNGSSAAGGSALPAAGEAGPCSSLAKGRPQQPKEGPTSPSEFVKSPPPSASAFPPGSPQSFAVPKFAVGPPAPSEAALQTHKATAGKYPSCGSAMPKMVPPAGGPPPATGGVVMPPPKGAPRPPLPTKSAPFGKPTAAGPPKGDTGVQCKSASAAPTPPPWQRPPEGKAFAAPHTSDDIEIQRGYQELTAMQQDFEQKHAEGERILQQQQQEVQRMEREFREHEQQRQREEMKRKKEEEERRRQEEAEALAKSLQNELEQFILIAERRAEEAKEKAALVGIDEKNDKTPDEILEAASQFDAVSAAGRMVVAQCNSFMTGKFLQLQGTTEETRTEAARRLKRVKAAESETAILVGKVMACRRQAQLQKDAQLKKLEAELAARKQEAIFSKYDRDGDGKLSAAEVGAFVSGECNFELSQEKLAAIVQSDVFKDSMGVPRAKFSHLRLLVGVAAVTGALDGMEVEVAKAETQARPLSAKGRCRMPIGPAAQKAEEVEAAVDAAQDYLAAAREQVQTLGADKPTGGEPRAVALARAEAVKLARRLDAFERRLATSAAIAKAVLDRRLLQERKAAALRDADLVASNGMM